MGDLAIKDEISVFSDEQISAAARLVAEGVGGAAIAVACGLDVNDLIMLQQDKRYKELASELASSVAVADIRLDDAWSGIEENAVALLDFELRHNADALSAMEKISIAKQANGARRRHGVLADRNKAGRMGDGVLDGGNGNGNNTIVINMPTMLVDRMKTINNTQAKVIETEKTEQDTFEANDLHSVDLEDVAGILDVTLDEDVGGNNQLEGLVTDLIQEGTELNSVADDVLSAVGIATSAG